MKTTFDSWSFGSRLSRAAVVACLGLTLFVGSFLASLLAPEGLATPSASADPRVVVLEFSGPKSEDIRDLVVEFAEDVAKVLPVSRFERASKRVDRFRPNAKGYRAVAERMELDGYVEGSIRKRRGKFEITISFRDSSGEEVDDLVEITVRKLRLSSSEERELRRGVQRQVRALGGGGDDDDDDDDDDDYDDDDDDDDDEYYDDDDDDDDDDEYYDDDDDDDDEYYDDDDDDDDYYDDDEWDLDGGADRSRGLEAIAGFSFNKRSLSFDADSEGREPQGYLGAMVPGMYIDASVFPLAFASMKGPLRGIGFTASYDSAFKIESKLQGMADVVLPTTQSRFGVGVVFRHNLNPNKDSGVTLRASFKYSGLSFNIDKTGAPEVTIPNVDYKFLEPGVMVTFPANPQIDIAAGAHFYILQATGEVQEAQQYGGAAVSGFDAMIGATYKIMPRMILKFDARYALISHVFDGTGSLTDRNSDGVQDVDGASDSFISIFTTFGYLL